MKHRSVMAVILYSILTVGIYDLFWLVSVKKELNAKTNVHTPTLWLLFTPLLLLVLGIVVAIAVPHGGSADSSTAASLVVLLVYLVGILAILPITFYWLFKFSKAVSEYTHGELSTAINFILLWLLRFIGMAIIQDKFNDMLAAGASGEASATAPYTPMAPQQAADPDASTPAAQGPNNPGAQPPTPPTNPIG